MKRAACLIVMCVMPSAFAAENILIDHATVASSDLNAMRKALLDTTGIQAEYGGPHSNHATEMALVSFPDGSYLELMGIQPKADPVAVSMHVWSKFLKENGGPCAFALRVDDIDREVRHLRTEGIPVGATEPSGRTRPDGVKLAWETVNVGPGNRGSLFPFLIRDLTPRANRVYPAGKPVTDRYSGVSKVVIGVHDLDTVIAQYRKAFDLPAPLRTKDSHFDANLAWFEGTPIVLAQGTTPQSWLTRRVHDFGDAPCAFVLKLGTQGMLGSPSRWFGKTIFWADEAQLGWRLGFEAK
jgi:hypothetical protein